MSKKITEKNLIKNGSMTILKQDREFCTSYLIEKGFQLKQEFTYNTIFIAPKKFNVTAFILWIILLNIFGLVGYLIYYANSKGKEVTVIYK